MTQTQFNNKILVFDMDGTIANLYGVEGWLSCLESGDPSPYSNAEPLVDMDVLNAILEVLKKIGYRIAVTSWLAKNATKEYDAAVRKAKRDWLKKYDFPFDELHLVKFGTTKADCTRKLGGHQILIDDNDKVLSGWSLGGTIDAKENIVAALVDLLLKEVSA